MAFIHGLPLSQTKITTPGRRPELLTRARLLEKLEDLLERRLILVTAPAGYGKTSLLIDFAQNTHLPVCWLSLDELDRDPQRFLLYFAAAIAARFPRFGKRSMAALAEATDFSSALENIVITFANEIYDQIDEHFVLVLDDYQCVDTVSEIRNFVSRFVQHAPENCHLVLASRRLPALPDMITLVAHQQVGGFDLEELAFRPEEIGLLFERNYGVSLTEEETFSLLRRTEGWITGLHLSRLSDSGVLPDLSKSARAAGIDLSDYFDQQVLAQQTPEMRAFLLQTSLLEEFDAALCDAVLGVGDWQTMMRTARQNNLFVLSVGPQGEWLRYNSLFQEFLRKRLLQESPTTVQAILLRLAEVSEENGDWEKAHHAIRQIGDLNALTAFMERAGAHLIQSDRILTLSAWLEELPPATIQENPSLLALNGFIALVRGQVKYGFEQTEDAAAMFRAQGNLAGLVFTLIQRSWAHRLLGNYPAALDDAEEAIQLAAEQPGQELRLAEAHRMKGLALFRLGRADSAAECLQTSLKIFTRLGRQREIPHQQMELGMVKRALGDLQAARLNYEKALKAWQQQGRLIAQATLLNNLGVLHHFCGDYEDAVRAFEQGLDCARRSGYLHSEGLLLSSLADVYAAIGDLEAAKQASQNAYEIALQSNDHFLLTYSRITLAGIARRSGDFDCAHRMLEDAEFAIRQSSSQYERSLYLLESASLHLAEGAPDRAAPDLKIAVENFEQGGLHTEAGLASLWLAAALARAGDLESACRAFAAAFRLAGDGETPASFLVAGLQVRAWLAPLSANEQAGPRLRLLLGQVEQFQKQLPSLRKRLRRIAHLVPETVPALSVRAFGRSQVRVNGQLVTNAQWRTKAVKELFFFLLQSPRPLTKEQIGLELWSESNAEALKRRFKNELYRLRRAVGPDVVLFDGERYRFNHDLDMEYDVEVFESSLKRARAAQDVEAQLRAYQEAVAAVRGLYLEDFDSIWLMADRERFRRRYVEALLAMAELLLKRGDVEEASKVCHYALAVDKTEEAAYRLMMNIHAARGDRIAVTREYQACRDTLASELGIPPSLETETLYRRLTA